MKAMQVLQDADDLAEFANLTADKVEHFRRKTTNRSDRPDFAPPRWWDHKCVTHQGEATQQWQFTQQLVQEAWDQHFQSDVGLFDLVRLLLSVFDPNDLLEVMMPLSSDPYRPAFADISSIGEESGFHRGVRYLAAEPAWRTKQCKECERRFVADHNERKYCSLAGEDGSKCSTKVEDRRHYEWSKANNWGRPVKAKKKRR